MIKIKPNDNPFDPVISTKVPNPENVSRGLTGPLVEHRPFKNNLERCLSGDETLVLSDAENVLSQSETIIDEDDLLSGEEDLLPDDSIVTLSDRRHFITRAAEDDNESSVFLATLNAKSTGSLNTS